MLIVILCSVVLPLQISFLVYIEDLILLCSSLGKCQINTFSIMESVSVKNSEGPSVSVIVWFCCSSARSARLDVRTWRGTFGETLNGATEM